MTDTSALAQSEQRLLQTNKENWTYAAGQATLLGHWSLHHVQAIARRQIEAAQQTATALSTLAPQFLAPKAVDALFEYANDSAQRWILFLDTLCQRGEAVSAREKEAFAPVLAFDYDMIVDGRKLERHVPHALGSLERPMSNAELEAKFLGLCDGVLSRARAEQALALYWRAEQLPDARALVAASTAG